MQAHIPRPMTLLEKQQQLQRQQQRQQAPSPQSTSKAPQPPPSKGSVASASASASAVGVVSASSIKDKLKDLSAVGAAHVQAAKENVGKHVEAASQKASQLFDALRTTVSEALDQPTAFVPVVPAAAGTSAGGASDVATPAAADADESLEAPLMLEEQTRAVVVFFIGGVTFAEISALRFVARTRGVKILIATTGIVTGARMLDEVIGDLAGKM